MNWGQKMKIYPKLSENEYCEEFNKKILEAEGIEIQFFDQNGITSEFNFEDAVRGRKMQYPQLKEIVVHPPLANYNIEHIFFKDENILKKQLEKMVELSKELNIDISFVYHTFWTVEQWVATGFASRLGEQLKLLEGTSVTVLIENLFMLLDEKGECSALEVCKQINHPNLRCCIDTTHMHCKANIYKRSFLDMVRAELNKDDCEKYVKQVHFAATLNNDGYIEKKTHGRKHSSPEELKAEYDWVNELGMGEKHFVTEVSEDDYYTRADQIEEIEMLKAMLSSNQ